jgi:hypothetical protein
MWAVAVPLAYLSITNELDQKLVSLHSCNAALFLTVSLPCYGERAGPCDRLCTSIHTCNTVATMVHNRECHRHWSWFGVAALLVRHPLTSATLLIRPNTQCPMATNVVADVPNTRVGEGFSCLLMAMAICRSDWSAIVEEAQSSATLGTQLGAEEAHAQPSAEHSSLKGSINA